MLTVFARGDAATAAIGVVLAGYLSTGDVVILNGDLGSGKTALARAIIRARLGDTAMEVPSPTFAIVQPYPGLVHADLYRLADESEAEELGLFEDEDAILLVEWADRVPGLARRAGYTIALGMADGGDARTITIAATGGRDLAALTEALAPYRAPGSN